MGVLIGNIKFAVSLAAWIKQSLLHFFVVAEKQFLVNTVSASVVSGLGPR